MLSFWMERLGCFLLSLNKAFKFKDKSVEVISSWDKGGFDQDLFNQLGIEIYEQPQKKKRYENSILLKSPEIDFLKIANERNFQGT